MLVGFKKRFSPMVEAGTKTHTIRDFRKRWPQPGDTIHCYEALRTKHTRLLGRWPCTKVEVIKITEAGAIGISDEVPLKVHATDWGFDWLDEQEREALARRDGFSSAAEMLSFFKGRLPFAGNIIHWDFNRPVTEIRK